MEIYLTCKYFDLILIFLLIALKEMFYNKFDRIDIIKEYRKNVGEEIVEEERLHERCYNIKKLERLVYAKLQLTRETGVFVQGHVRLIEI